jgi:m7GpppX diphosphatase
MFIYALTIDPLSKFASTLGTILDKPAILVVEKTAFGDDLPTISNRLGDGDLIGRNDIYRWYLAAKSEGSFSLKATLIYPATEVHIRKHEKQRRRMIKETPEIYMQHVEKYIQAMKGSRIQWYNILLRPF